MSRVHTLLRRWIAAATLALALHIGLTAAQDRPQQVLAEHIPLGLWELSAQRAGLLKPLSWRYREEDTSRTCIRSEPHQHLLDWVARKGCSVASEQVLPDGYGMTGECRLKWLPGRPIPVEVTLTWREAGRFDMTIRSRENGLLTYTELTRATFIGPCESAKAEINSPGR